MGTGLVKSRRTRSGRGLALGSGTVVRFLAFGVQPRIPSSRISLSTLYRVRRRKPGGSIACTKRKPNLRSDSSHTRITASRSADHPSRGRPPASHE